MSVSLNICDEFNINNHEFLLAMAFLYTLWLGVMHIMLIFIIRFLKRVFNFFIMTVLHVFSMFAANFAAASVHDWVGVFIL